MRERGDFKVVVTKDYLVFASAHFITFAGHRCESLHGHNYRVEVVVEGALEEESWYVYDFVALKRLMRRLCNELDHRVLLPRDNPKLAITERDSAISVAYEGTLRYIFPAGDCIVLPVPNTTVEMLAEYLAGRVRAEIGDAGDAGAARLSAIQIEVEENFGQSAVYRERLG
ncbi:MAG: 6-pyruvoyl tetrahydropterin synthase family protein [Gemmatimonadaceae bacterium]